MTDGIGTDTPNSSYYFDQYPCIAQNNYYNLMEGSNNYNSLQVNYQKFLSQRDELDRELYVGQVAWAMALIRTCINSLGYRAPAGSRFRNEGRVRQPSLRI